MKSIVSYALLATALSLGLQAVATPSSASAEACPPYTATFQELLDNPKSRSILETHIPELVNSGNLDNAKGMTLPELRGALQQWAPDVFTAETLKDIEKDLAACS